MLCGHTEVPCLVMEVDQEQAGVLALIENLQRRDLDFWEEAVALDQLIQRYGLSQEGVAAKVGKSQSAVANKLRLLKLPEAVLHLLRQHGCTERHARALLRLPDEKAQLTAAQKIVQEGWTVARTERYVEEVCRTQPREAPRRSLVIRDVRFFLNSLDHSLSLMRAAGVDAQYRKEEAEGALLLTIRIPKATAGAKP
jgi:ParB family chromosome partitioning protein